MPPTRTAYAGDRRFGVDTSFAAWRCCFPTLIGIITVNFFIVQFAPGGPVDQMIATLTGQDAGATSRIAGAQSGGPSEIADVETQYAGAQGLDPELIAAIEAQFGFDKPIHERYLKMLGDYLTFDLGNSYYQDRPVVDLIKERLPVSIFAGPVVDADHLLPSRSRWALPRRCATGRGFDAWTSGTIFVGYAVPSFLFAIFLIVLLAGGSYLDLFPLKGLTSSNFDELFVHRQGGRLLLAPRAAGHGPDHRRVRHPDHAHQELVPGRDRQAVRADGPRRGPQRAPRALRPRVPQPPC